MAFEFLSIVHLLRQVLYVLVVPEHVEYRLCLSIVTQVACLRQTHIRRDHFVRNVPKRVQASRNHIWIDRTAIIARQLN